jgi:hypothetical protein
LKNRITGVYKPGDAGIHLFAGTTENKIAKNKIADVNTPILDEGTDNIINP